MARTPKAKTKTTSRSNRAESPSNKKPSGQGNFHVEFKNEAQGLAWAAFKQHDVLFLAGPAGCGKALTMNSKLFTRNGPILMKNASIGLKIANPDGAYSKITGVYPQGKKQVCRVHFTDETYVDCCEEHLWSVSHSDNGWKNRVVDTRYLEHNCLRKDGKHVLSIKATKPVNFERKEYAVSPYLMGILISEGNLTNSNVVFTSCESEVLECVSSLLVEGYECKSKGIDHRIVKTKRSNASNFYKEELKNIGLWGVKSYEKFIPSEYQFGSVDQRIALLQGMMDGDGGVEKTGAVYCTTSFELAENFCQLIYSLGGTTKIRRKEGSLRSDGSRHRVSYRCYVNLPSDINIFFLQRKSRLLKARSKYFPKRYIARVERRGMEEMQCISVDHKDSLYLTDNFTVTHNTHLACAFAIEQILSNEKKKIVMTRPVVEAGESLGFLPGDLQEKINPYMTPMYDCMDKIVGKEGPWRDKINYSMKAAPLAFMRGVTFDDSICILDEAQNASMMQLKLFMTRFGQNSKLIITGDPTQSDLAGNVALTSVMQKLRSVEGIGIVEFKSSQIVRHPLISKIIEKLEG